MSRSAAELTPGLGGGEQICREKLVNECDASTDGRAVGVVGVGSSDDGDKDCKETHRRDRQRATSEGELAAAVRGVDERRRAGRSHGRAGTEIAVEYGCLGRGCCASGRLGHVRGGSCVLHRALMLLYGRLACSSIVHIHTPLANPHIIDRSGLFYLCCDRSKL